MNIFGMHFSGKEEIEKRHVKIHETFLKDSTFRVLDFHLREVKSDLVIAQIFWEVDGIKQSDGSTKSIRGVFLHTIVKKNDNWEIASTQNTLISKPLA